MANGEDPFGKQYDDSYVNTTKDYELEQVDKDSVAEIKKLLSEGKYTEPDYLRDHMEYLENLLQKLVKIIQDEKRMGKMNLSLERDFAKIKELYDQLGRLLDKLES